MATGLSALYSELPQKLGSNENFDEIRYLQRDDVHRIPALKKFINSLEFCNNVIQVSHSLIANHLLQYVYFGFLVPVVAPALTQVIIFSLYSNLYFSNKYQPTEYQIIISYKKKTLIITKDVDKLPIEIENLEGHVVKMIRLVFID